MSVKPSRTYTKHAATLASGTVGESFVRGIRKAFTAIYDRDNGYVGATASAMACGELDSLLASIREAPPRIDADQAAKGLAWLKRRAVQKVLGFRERDIIERFDYFTLSDFIDASENSRPFYVPVYTVHAKDGRSFAYYCGSWQSGIPLCVVG